MLSFVMNIFLCLKKNTALEECILRSNQLYGFRSVFTSQTGCIKLHIANIFKRGKQQIKKNVERLSGQKVMTISHNSHE